VGAPGLIRCFDAVLPHGITLSCRAAGTSGPRVMLLHGFPEAAFAWDGVMTALADRVECLAPNLRGYERSSAPPQAGAYHPRELVADVAALILQWGAPLDLLVAHDWGGALAWNLAARRPDLLRRLLIVNAPHPAAFLRELRDNPQQQAASAYMNVLARADAEVLLAEDGFARLWRMLDSPWRRLVPAQRHAYAEVWRHGLTGPLNWYRASPLRPPGPGQDTLAGVQLPDEAVTVRVPTHVLWGLDDPALLPALLDGLGRWVPDLNVQRVPEASHWIVHERPALVREAIRALLAR
jgi:pimeloyl-ACP methyl ester carboxylesterase